MLLPVSNTMLVRPAMTTSNRITTDATEAEEYTNADQCDVEILEDRQFHYG